MQANTTPTTLRSQVCMWCVFGAAAERYTGQQDAAGWGNKRGSLCVSSQVGCQMGCTFCATGEYVREAHSIALQQRGSSWHQPGRLLLDAAESSSAVSCPAMTSQAYGCCCVGLGHSPLRRLVCVP